MRVRILADAATGGFRAFNTTMGTTAFQAETKEQVAEWVKSGGHTIVIDTPQVAWGSTVALAIKGR